VGHFYSFVCFSLFVFALSPTMKTHFWGHHQYDPQHTLMVIFILVYGQHPHKLHCFSWVGDAMTQSKQDTALADCLPYHFCDEIDDQEVAPHWVGKSRAN